jgi:competence protein ComK
MNFITRHAQGCLVGGKNEIIKLGIRQYIDSLCVNNLSTFEGRIEAAKRLLHRTQLVPVYVDRNTLLFPTGAIRNLNMYYVNYHQIANVFQEENSVYIIFHDGSKIKIQTSKRSVLLMMRFCAELLVFIND